MKDKSILFLGLFIVSCSFNRNQVRVATDHQKRVIAQISNETKVNDELRWQVETSFEEKFKRVTSNIKETSDRNIEKLRQAFKEKRSYINYLSQAIDLAKVQDSRFGVFHGTSISIAQSIFNSKAFLSLDELIRRDILNLEEKRFKQSIPSLDGIIGEQDVVFFSLEQSNPKKLNEFGVVEFELFKGLALDAGYFSLSSFGLGLFNPRDFNSLEMMTPSSLVFETISYYEDMIFKGKEAYHNILLFTQIQNLWEKSNHKKIMKLKKTNSLNHVSLKLLNIKKFFKKIRFFEFDKWFSFYGQKVPLGNIQFYSKSIFHGLVNLGFDIPQNEKDFTFYKLEETKKDFSYPRFPISFGSLPGILMERTYFFELKIPRQVSLDLVKAIRIPIIRNGVKNKNSLKKLRETILKYAKNERQTFKISTNSDYEIIKMSQF